MEPTLVFERGENLYIVGPVAPITPGDTEVAAFAFAESLRKAAPNEALLWLRGQYVEGDRANRNGQYWASKEIAIKSLTPRFMPVTVMHEPRTAVGLIADTKLLLPGEEAAAGVPRARIDTALAVWAHRFPEVAEECAVNYAQGTLMQSMECNASHYECIDCGRGFVKLPGGAERANWCAHLQAGAENGIPVRRLCDVTFTGTGLIFGTRNGATGAMDKAHLDTFQSEVAEFHERAVTDRRPTRRTSKMDIEKNEYDRLVAEAARAVTLAAQVAALEPEVAKLAPLQSKLEAAEIAKTAAEAAAATEKAARELLEETARTAGLASDRVSKLGASFLAKLGAVKETLTTQAGTLDDAAWTARLDELALLTGVKHDDGAPVAPAPGTVTTETAATQLGGAAPVVAGGVPARASVQTVLGGLFAQTRRQAPTPPKPAGQ
jgi:hypothetical protein